MNKKRLIYLLIFAFICVLGVIVVRYDKEKISLAYYDGDAKLVQAGLKVEKIGIGGGGALFEPSISPFNSNDMLAVPDMGGLYISHNKGISWDRVNLHGTVINAKYDPNRPGVIYAGGSGLYRSTDNGKSFELLFPSEDDIITKRLHNGNSLQYYFTKSGVYDRNRNIKDILIDPNDSNHIFALGYYSKNGVVYESIDNGATFSRLFTYTTNTTASSLQWDFNELIYRSETRDLFVINRDGIIGYSLDSKSRYDVYSAPVEIMDVSTVYQNNKTYFVILEKVSNRDNTETVIYYTNDFINKVDLTDRIINDIDNDIIKNTRNNAITEVGKNYFVHKTYGKVTYKYRFRYVSATSLNNIYVANWTNAITSSVKDYPYSIDGIIHYKDGNAKYLYGNPFRDHNFLAGRSWNDGCTYALGISASKHHEDEFIFTTLNGIYYSYDNEHIYPRHTTLVDGVFPNATFVTNGIDEQRTYGVMENPSNNNELLLLNTDLGLIRSTDNGNSWSWIRSGVPNNWSNTIYDAEYDIRSKGVVYSIWSGRHNAPLNAGNETDGRYGGFAISYDSGVTWDSTYSSGLPSYVIPVKMSVVYPDNADAIIYLATFNCGFYVSYDAGKNFIEMNNGLDKIQYKSDSKYHYIFAQDIEVKDGRIFGLTTKTNYNGSTQPGELFEYVNNNWVKLDLPDKVVEPVDIYYYDGTLYISAFAQSVWDGKNGASWNLYYGGIYTYKDHQVNNIYDDSKSITSVVFDSKGTMYVSDMEGNVYRKEKGKDYAKIYENYHYRSESLQISMDDDRLYLSTHGGGMLRISNLNSLYHHEHTGGIATCTKRAICSICGEEYGSVNPNNHVNEGTKVVNRVEATYDHDGYTGDVLYDCGALKEVGRTIPKLTNNDKVYYSVIFDSNGGTSVSESKVIKGNKVVVPSTPSKAGYRFVEWQYNGKRYDFNQPVEGNIRLVAVWERITTTTTRTTTITKRITSTTTKKTTTTTKKTSTNSSTSSSTSIDRTVITAKKTTKKTTSKANNSKKGGVSILLIIIPAIVIILIVGTIIRNIRN